ncbi:MAG TPA: hypothetical protein DDY21_03445 [Candidatus Moranbacteria bacterium]|nr:hypothetical protein [Candidatus Moranbacteria bacterium]HCO99572.1 hypothetical protein [Candidatus Moranbacteria bacterium]
MKKIAVLSIVLGATMLAVNLVSADITIKNSNSFSGTQNVTANPTATASVSDVSASATGGSAYATGGSAIILNSGNSSGYVSASTGTGTGTNGTSGTIIAASGTTGGTTAATGGTSSSTGGTSSANAGTTTAITSGNTSVSQSGEFDSDSKIVIDKDGSYTKKDKHGRSHRYDKNGKEIAFKKLPASGSGATGLTMVAILALITAAFGVKKYSAQVK